jgi:polar amino acid transport system substrate-binding protein
MVHAGRRSFWDTLHMDRRNEVRRVVASALLLLSALWGMPVMAADATTAVLAELAPTGRLRVAINFGNPVLAQKDAATGEARGVSVALARELGRRLKFPVDLVTFDAAGKVFEALKSSAWDVAFLAIEPVRAAEIDFSPPYVVIEGVYMVPANSPLRSLADVDHDGIRIAVGKGSAYDLFLTRTLKHAELVRAPTSAGAVDLFRDQKLDVAAGVKQPLAAFAAKHADVRLIAERFMAIRQAMGTPKGRSAGAAYLKDFIEEMKASGFVAQALKDSGQGDAEVAPAGTGD